MLTQLGECCRHMAKVVGSSPIHPTIMRLRQWTGSFLLLGSTDRWLSHRRESGPQIRGRLSKRVERDPGRVSVLPIFCPVFQFFRGL